MNRWLVFYCNRNEHSACMVDPRDARIAELEWALGNIRVWSTGNPPAAALAHIHHWTSAFLRGDPNIGDAPRSTMPTQSVEEHIAALRDARIAELEAALEEIIAIGTRNETERIGDMYAENGYRVLEIISDEANLARTALRGGK